MNKEDKSHSRRRFLKGAAVSVASATTGAAMTGTLSGCGSGSPQSSASDGSSSSGGNNVFQHGVASGDPLTDRVILWTRITPPEGVAAVAVTLSVWRDAEQTDLAREETLITTAEVDFTLKADFTGLDAGNTYYYQFAALGEQSPLGRTRTIPTDPDSARFVVATCGDYSRGLWNAYARIGELDGIDAVIHLGDYIYETDRDRVRAHQPPIDLVTLADYRARYASYRVEPELQETHRQHPMIWVWDDHETVDGAWREGADPNDHDPDIHGPYIQREANGIQAAYEWLPIRLPEPNSEPRRIYRQFSWGDLLDLFMLDTRRIDRDKQGEGTITGDFFRQTDAPFNDHSRHILGETQEQWLLDGLAASQQRGVSWRLLGNQVVFSQIKITGQPDNTGAIYANPDQWDGYKGARERVLDSLAANSVDNVVFLTGDVHASMVYEASRDPHDGSYVAGTGVGSFATEFVAPSISSAGDPASTTGGDPEDTILAQGADALRANNPHMRYIEATRNGYCIADINRDRLRMEYWLVPTVLSETDEQTNEVNFIVNDGTAAVQQEL